ncbi:MAG: DUF4838 domain-containing protein [Planctomycetota bacterium]|nr:DUF4838 domain-containing protein [Planctomycetota bacterium]
MRMPSTVTAVVTLLAAATQMSQVLHAQGTLVADGRAGGCIVIREDLPLGALRTAAENLSSYLKSMSGVRVPLCWDTQRCPGFRIYIGSTRLQPLDPDVVSPERVGYDGFVIKTVPGGLQIAGRTDRGTRHGVYHFAEEVLGVHWFTLEEDAPSCPQRRTIRIPELDWTVKPDFRWHRQSYTINRQHMPKRLLQNYGAWSAFNRVGGVDGSIGHVYDAIVPDALFQTHPEYFPLLDGKRTPGRLEVQRCLSHPQVLQRAIAYSAAFLETNYDQWTTSLSGNDGVGWCECDGCRELGPTPSYRAFRFANTVAGALQERFPGRGFSVLAYMDTLEPPVGLELHPNVVPWLAFISQCRVHSIHSDCPDAVEKRRIVRAWQQLAGEFYWYSYLAGGPFHAPAPIAMAEEMRFMHEHGCVGGFREHTAGPQTGWALLNWMEVQLHWDVAQDPRALRRQFLEGYYGLRGAAAAERVYAQIEEGLLRMPTAPARGRPYGHNNLAPPFFGPVAEPCRPAIEAALQVARQEPDRTFARRMARDMGNLLGGVPADLVDLLKE